MTVLAVSTGTYANTVPITVPEAMVPYLRDMYNSKQQRCHGWAGH